MPTFGKRVHAAMMSSGDATVTNLARVGKFSIVTARKWLLRKSAHEDMLALLRVAAHTNVRMQWLITGKGPVRSLRCLNDWELRAVEVLERLPRDKIETWLSDAERQVSKET